MAVSRVEMQSMDREVFVRMVPRDRGLVAEAPTSSKWSVSRFLSAFALELMHMRV